MIDGVQQAIAHPDLSEFEQEKQKLRAEFEQAMREMRASYENEQKNKEKLQSDLSKLVPIFSFKISQKKK